MPPALQSSIRQAGADDADSIGAISVATWQATYGGIIPADYLAGLSAATSAERWRAGLSNPNTRNHVYLAEVNQTAVGFGSCGPVRDNLPPYDGEVYALYVLPAYQRHGLGRALVRACARDLQARGCGHMLIWVLADNRPSIQFYEALGGVCVARKSIKIGGTRLPELGYGYRTDHLL